MTKKMATIFRTDGFRSVLCLPRKETVTMRMKSAITRGLVLSLVMLGSLALASSVFAQGAAHALSRFPNLLRNPGFESGPDGTWISSPDVIGSWGNPHSGYCYAWLNGYGQKHTDWLSQTVTIPSAVTSATLSFWLGIKTDETTTVAEPDRLKVQIRNDYGVTLATLATYSNLDATPDYRYHSFDVTPFRGQKVQVYFLGYEDSSRPTSFFIDDTALRVTPSFP